MKKKMYKSKKHWVVVGISGLSVLTALSLNDAVKADDSVLTNKGESTLQSSSDNTLVSTKQSVDLQTLNLSVTKPVVTAIPEIQKQTDEITEVSESTKTVNSVTGSVKPVTSLQTAVAKQAIVNSTVVETKPTVTYASHISNIGWQKSVVENEVSGQVASSNQLEAIKIDLEMSNNQTSGISYSSLVRGQGWQDAVNSGQISGTVGKNTPIEAISAQLTGDLAISKDIYYRVFVKNMGWLKWTCNGQYAGTSGLNASLEAYEVMILKKGQFQESIFNTGDYTKPTLNYQVFVEKDGWQNPVSEGNTSGTVAQSKQVEAVKINLSSTEYGNLVYKTHIQDIGWQTPVKDNEVSGLANGSKQVEAIQIELTGQLVNRFDIFYRVHVQDIGWQNWVKNNQIAGTVGQARQIEAVEIKLVEKTNIIVESPKVAFIDFVKPKLSYKTYVEKYGWQIPVSEGYTSGTTSQNKRLEGFVLFLDDKTLGDVTYKVHVQNIGWMNNLTANQVAGLPGQGLQIEAIQLGLTGVLAEKYDIFYRAHVQDIGWQGWTRNNFIAGTVGQSKQIEALEVKLVEKPLQNIALIINQSEQKGTADVLFTKGLNTKVIREVKLAVWSLADKSNINYYTAPVLVNGQTIIHINENNHKYISGNYKVVAYTYYEDGSMQEINVGTTYFNAPTTTVYYNQKSAPWGSKVYGKYYFGPTGCVPTSLAMIFSSLSGSTILPSQVGDYLYNQTNEFNKGGNYGTTSAGLQSAVKAFGYQATNLTSLAMLTSALQDGHHVAFAIQNNIFVSNGSHEMVLKGYNNGNAYVYDPYTKELCGWYSINTLWNQRSTDPSDNINIKAPFFKITTL